MSDTLGLINRWQGGEQRAAELLYDQNRNRVYRLAYGLLGNAEDAEEVAQDALTYALVNIKRYQPEKALFTTWLHTITVSRVRDRQRKLARRLKLTSLSEWLEYGKEPIDEDIPLEQQSEQLFGRKQIMTVVQSLSPQLREAIVLRYWAQHSFKEMATIMGCPLGTAQSRVRRGFEALRKRLSPELLEEFGG